VSNLPNADVVHNMPGRMRIRFAGRRGERSFFESVSETLRHFDGVLHVQANPDTGSILILHETDQNGLLRNAAEAGLFAIGAAKAPGELPTVRARQIMQAADSRISTATRGAWDLNSVLMLACAVAGGVQVMRQNVLPAAASMLWYAMALAAEKNGIKQRQ